MSSDRGWLVSQSPILLCDDLSALEKCRAALADAISKNGAENLSADFDVADPVAGFLLNVMALSPYLSSSILRYLSCVDKAVECGVTAAIEQHLADISISEKMTESELMAHLRRAKGAVHLLIALGDLSGRLSVEQTTSYLTALAEKTLNVGFDWLLLDLHAAGKIQIADLSNPSKDSGLIVLGMGKMGGCELNYSSDIDIVIYFDLEQSKLQLADGQDPTSLFGRMVRQLIRIMQERTGDGYVFRIDLRLRPDPGATPLAISVEAALNYYESRGQNWERAAFIKARPVAGDIVAGDRYLEEMKPFIWRKYLDYAAISDIQAIKRQIHAHKGHGKIRIHGHNLKLGRGGIREIEFFVQTQQLIAGGRATNLRHPNTVEMLDRLSKAGWISVSVRDDLTRAYNFLRRGEHVIQMIADEQTHNLPDDDEGLKVVAGLMRYAQVEQFKSDLESCLQTVEKHFGDLFEDEDTLSARSGNLVFTGEDPDPDTLATLSAMGFVRPKDMWSVIRSWHFGRYRALQTEKSREQLTSMMPSLLDSFAQTGTADATLLRFDSFLSGLPTGMQLFSMLNSNRHLLGLLSTILSAAPRLADIITKRPLIFDGMLDPAFFDGLPDQSDVRIRLLDFLAMSNGYEDSLDRLRIFAAEQRFLIGVRFLTMSINAQTSGRALSSLADELLTQALDLAVGEVEAKHGKVDGASLCLVAMGRLGSQELTAGSDVDLLLIYDCAADDKQSDGDRPLAPSQYFARVTQRLIAALSAPTAEGVLYDVDFRLRPSGNKGPLATSLTSFRKYQMNDAWTWEHMALTRARAVCGSASLIEQVEAVREEVICATKDTDKIAADVRDMRQRLRKEKPAQSQWDLKMSDGGLLDIEFISQFLMLTALPICNAELPNSNLNIRNARDILNSSSQDIVSSQDKQQLLDALSFFTTIDHLVKLCSSQSFEPKTAPKGLLDQICSATQLPDISHVEMHLVAHQNAVKKIFDRVLRTESG